MRRARWSAIARAWDYLLGNAAPRKYRRPGLGLEALEAREVLSTAYHPLATGALVQDWSDPGLLTAPNDWSGVPSIVGYLGNAPTIPAGADPRTVTADIPTPVNVTPNQGPPLLNNPTAAGGVAEFEQLANPTVGLNGSGTAMAPNLVLHLDTTGVGPVTVSFVLRDLDPTPDNAVQQVAVQYRVGPGGPWQNVPGGYVADASTGPGQATLVTPVSVVLPPDANGQPQVQVRILTTNAVGNDEWIGVDDIVVTGAPLLPTVTVVKTADTIEGSATSGAFTFTRTGDTSQPLTVGFAIDPASTASATSDYTVQGAGVTFDPQTLTGTVTFAMGSGTAEVTVLALADNTIDPDETVVVTLHGDAGYTVGTAGSATVMIADNPPVISVVDGDEQPVPTPASIEGEAINLRVAAFTPVSTTLTYSAVDLPPGLSIDSATGAITGTIAIEAATSGNAHDGLYLVTVTATDGTYTGTATLDWTVSSRITVHLADQQNVEGDSISAQVQAASPDNAALVYSAANLPTGLSINPTTGAITGTVSVGDATSGDDSQGDYASTITVTDGTYTGTIAMSWVVSSRIAVDVVDAEQSDATVQLNFEGDVASLQVLASTPDSTTLTYSATGLPDGLSIDVATGAITGTITPNTSTGGDGTGNYTATITVTDGTFTGTVAITWLVFPRLMFDPVNTQQNVEGDSVSLQVQATSPDTNATVTYSAADLPAGLGIDSATGAITGTISNGASTGGTGTGNYTTLVTATDGAYTGTVTVSWAVSSPVVASADSAFYLGAPLDVDVLANDSGLLGGLHVIGFTMGENGTITANTTGGLIYTQTGVPTTETDTFTYTIADSAGHQATAQVTVYTVPVFTFSNIIYTANGTDTVLTATVVRLGREDVDSDVSFRTDNLSAFAGLDFAATVGTLHFAAGDNVETFTVSLLDHDFFGSRAFRLTLENPTDGLIVGKMNGAVGEVVGTRSTPQGFEGLNAESVAALRLENRAQLVLLSGLGSLIPAQPPVAQQPKLKPAAPPPGLFVAGNQVLATDVMTLKYLLENGAHTTGEWLTAKSYLINGMVKSELAQYRFTTKEDALANLDFRLEALGTMLRIDGGKPQIKFGYAGSLENRKIDTNYWTLGTGFSATTNLIPGTNKAVSGYAAVITGLENGETRLECQTASTACYYIAAAKVLKEKKFLELFPAKVLLGGFAGNPFLDTKMPWATDSLADLALKFESLTVDAAALVQAGKIVPEKMGDDMNTVKGKINDILSKKQLSPLTGDAVYFSNSRFYRAVHIDGGWGGENTIVYRGKDNEIGYAGMGVDKQGRAQPGVNVKNTLVAKLNGEKPAEVAAVTAFKAALAASQNIIVAARANNMPVVDYVEKLWQDAIRFDVSATSYGSPRLANLLS